MDDNHRLRRRLLNWIKVGASGVFGDLGLGLSGFLMNYSSILALSTVGVVSLSDPLTDPWSDGAVSVGSPFLAAVFGVGAASMA